MRPRDTQTNEPQEKTQAEISLERALGYLRHANPHSEEFKKGLDVGLNKNPHRALIAIEKRLARLKQQYPEHYAYEEYWLERDRKENDLMEAQRETGEQIRDIDMVLYAKVGPAPERPNLDEPFNSPVHQIRALLKAESRCKTEAIRFEMQEGVRKIAA